MPGLRKKQTASHSHLKWAPDTELVGLEFELVLEKDAYLYPEYSKGLHAWFLREVQQYDPQLSAYLHDGESEKAFTISGLLDGKIISSGRQVKLLGNTTYYWYVAGLSNRVIKWMQQWVKKLPDKVSLHDASLHIRSCNIAHTPTTYQQLLNSKHEKSIILQFITPTSFRRKNHHFPLPLPTNLFHSYLRRWNNFSGMIVDNNDFLTWIDDCVFINRCQITTSKVLAGKRGAVTGFTGAIELSLTQDANNNPEYQQLFYALGKLAPYCGTGHKTTFGLGQTRLGWLNESTQEVPVVETVLTQRIEELAEIFKAQRKRTGGTRAVEIASKWATILARREMGESIPKIAEDLQMPYETVKTYVKLARRALKDDNG
jgi:CRISPR-associated endoribonuclease Cas6